MSHIIWLIWYKISQPFNCVHLDLEKRTVVLGRNRTPDAGNEFYLLRPMTDLSHPLLRVFKLEMSNILGLTLTIDAYPVFKTDAFLTPVYTTPFVRIGSLSPWASRKLILVHSNDCIKTSRIAGKIFIIPDLVGRDSYIRLNKACRRLYPRICVTVTTSIVL